MVLSRKKLKLRLVEEEGAAAFGHPDAAKSAKKDAQGEHVEDGLQKKKERKRDKIVDADNPIVQSAGASDETRVGVVTDENADKSKKRKRERKRSKVASEVAAVGDEDRLSNGKPNGAVDYSGAEAEPTPGDAERGTRDDNRVSEDEGQPKGDQETENGGNKSMTVRERKGKKKRKDRWGGAVQEKEEQEQEEEAALAASYDGEECKSQPSGRETDESGSSSRDFIYQDRVAMAGSVPREADVSGTSRKWKVKSIRWEDYLPPNRSNRRAGREEYNPKKVYVGGMPYYITEDEIVDYFSECGKVTELDCVLFPDTGKFRGLAFITFQTDQAARKALEWDGCEMGGRFLKITKCKVRPQKGNKNSELGEVQKHQGCLSVYIGNLSWDITEDVIKSFLKTNFKETRVEAIRLAYDQVTGEFRGFGHIDFEDDDSLEAAVSLNQTPLLGRPVKIAYSVPKRRPPTKNSGTGGQGRPNVCYSCGKEGHKAFFCEVKGGIIPERDGKIKRR